MQYDLLVVGGGPCGLSAAISAARAGYSVLCLDRKKSPGFPVKCAEGIGKYLLPHLPFSLPKSIFKNRIKGVHFWHDDYDVIKKDPYFQGYTIDRTELESWLTNCAKDAGAIVYFNHNVKSISLEGSRFRHAVVQVGEKKRIFEAKNLLICDGADSSLVRSLGVKLGGSDLINVYSWEAKNIDLTEPEYEQVIFSKSFSNGYGYIFPKSRKTANIGIGEAFLEMPILKKKFFSLINLKQFSSQFKNVKFTVERSKAARFSGGINNLHFENIGICGDAANINYKPLIEGILPAIISGYAAGEYLCNVGKKDVGYSVYIESKLPNWNENLILTSEMKKLFNNDSDSSLPLFAMCAGLLNPNDLIEFSKKPKSKQNEICLTLLNVKQ